MAVLRKCVCCGKEYEFCPGCHKKDQPAWMATFCSEPCKELFNIVSAYNTKRINKDAVKKYMSEHNLDISKYVDAVKKVLNEATETEPKIEKPAEKNSISERKTEKASATPSPIIRQEHKAAIVSDNNNLEHRSRRNKKRRTRQLDIDLT